MDRGAHSTRVGAHGQLAVLGIQQRNLARSVLTPLSQHIVAAAMCAPLGAAAGFDEADEARIFGMPLAADAIGMANATTSVWGGYGSDNPATVGAIHDDRTLAITATNVAYSAAQDVAAAEVDLTLPFAWGTLDISLGNAQSDRGVSRGGDDFAIEKDPYLLIMFGAEVARGAFTPSDTLYLGVSAAPRIDHTKYTFYDGDHAALKTNSDIDARGAGMLYKPDDRTGFGVSYNVWRIHTDLREVGVGRDHDDLSLEWWKFAGSCQLSDSLFASVEYRRFSGSERTEQWAIGGEYCLSEAVCGYAGYGAGPTLGIGYYGSDRIAINVGYARRIADRVQGQFGQSPTVSVTIVVYL